MCTVEYPYNAVQFITTLPSALQWHQQNLNQIWDYSENTRVCAKWQWNARDCVTGLHDRRICHIHILYKQNWDSSWLMNLTPKIYLWLHIFQIRNLFHCVAESWWNMPFKGTRHGNGVTDGAVAKLLRLWRHASAFWHHAVWIRIVTPHNAWMGYEYSLPNMNLPREIHKHDPHPLETIGHVW